MEWAMVSGICAVIFTLLQIVSAVIALKIREEISAIKLHVAEARAKDRDDLKEWTETHYMPRKEAEASFRRWQNGVH